MKRVSKSIVFAALTALVWISLITMACKKKSDEPNSYSVKYRLTGWFYRDSIYSGDGLKGVHFSDDGSYCWLSLVDGQDSLRCDGNYIQTSDSTLLWNNSMNIAFKLTILDSAKHRAAMFMTTQPPSYAMVGYYK